jgi:prevent-host-death family protein
MTEVASRELRNETASVLKRVQQGEDVVITVNGRPVARLVPADVSRRRWMPRAEVAELLHRSQADAALRHELAELVDEPTGDLDSIA